MEVVFSHQENVRFILLAGQTREVGKKTEKCVVYFLTLSAVICISSLYIDHTFLFRKV